MTNLPQELSPRVDWLTRSQRLERRAPPAAPSARPEQKGPQATARLPRRQLASASFGSSQPLTPKNIPVTRAARAAGRGRRKQTSCGASCRIASINKKKTQTQGPGTAPLHSAAAGSCQPHATASVFEAKACCVLVCSVFCPAWCCEFLPAACSCCSL